MVTACNWYLPIPNKATVWSPVPACGALPISTPPSPGRGNHRISMCFQTYDEFRVISPSGAVTRRLQPVASSVHQARRSSHHSAITISPWTSDKHDSSSWLSPRAALFLTQSSIHPSLSSDKYPSLLPLSFHHHLASLSDLHLLTKSLFPSASLVSSPQPSHQLLVHI